MASIRSDYTVPSDYHGQAIAAKQAKGSVKRHGEDLQGSRQSQQQANAAVQAQRDKIREARLRTAWEQLSQAERDAILVVVKDENPGLGRWKNMLEPLCLSILETRIKASGDEVSQQLLFPEVEAVH